MKYNFLETCVLKDSSSTIAGIVENIYFYGLYANILAYLKSEIFSQSDQYFNAGVNYNFESNKFT